jgi:hypothetical protein
VKEIISPMQLPPPALTPYERRMKSIQEKQNKFEKLALLAF